MSSALRPLWSLLRADLRQLARQPGTWFINLFLPTGLLVVFAEMLDVRTDDQAALVVAIVLVFGVLGNGLFGAGGGLVPHRDRGVLRRLRVSPISPVPVLAAC